MNNIIVVPVVPGENGNTNHSPLKEKRISPALRWCFTYNNYPLDYKISLVPRFQELCKKYIIGEEKGESGTPHLQGAIWLKAKARPTSLNLPKQIHWEPMRNEEASYTYCKKDDIFIEYGFPAPIKTLSILRPWQADAERLIIDNEPDGRSLYWFYDNKGGAGKSAFCKYMYIKHNALIIQGGKLADIINIIFNSNMDKIKCLIIDIPRNTGNKISYNAIECILNGMITNTKYETGIKVFNPPHVIVFSNEEPELFKLSLDRWIVKNIEGSVPS